MYIHMVVYACHPSTYTHVVYTCHPSTWESEAGDSRVWGQPRALQQHRSQNQNQNTKLCFLEVWNVPLQVCVSLLFSLFSHAQIKEMPVNADIILRTLRVTFQKVLNRQKMKGLLHGWSCFHSHKLGSLDGFHHLQWLCSGLVFLCGAGDGAHSLMHAVQALFPQPYLVDFNGIHLGP